VLAEREPEAREDEADLAARHHPERDGEAVRAAGGAEGARELAEDGGEGETKREGEGGEVDESAEVGADAEESEEERDEESAEGLDLLVEPTLAAVEERAPVRLLQHETSGEGADDGGEADGVGGPG